MAAAYTRPMESGQGPADSVARAAVRALAEGRARSVDDAIDHAIEEQSRGLRTGRIPRPSRALLRAHAQAMEESAHGDLARRIRIESTLQEILSVLSALDELRIVHDPEHADRPGPRVYGRAARAEFDLDPTVRIRIVTAVPAHVLAQGLADSGFGDTEVAAIETKYGMLDQICFATSEAEYRVTRIPPRMQVDPRIDLTKGKPVESADFEALLGLLPRFGNH